MNSLLQFGRRPLSSLPLTFRHCSYCGTAQAVEGREQARKKGRGGWFTLPPFTPAADAASVAKQITTEGPAAEAAPMTVLKWIRCCCPELPTSLVQKLFRLRQVRKEMIAEIASSETQAEVRRVSAKDAMVSGDVIFLPIKVQKHPIKKNNTSDNKDAADFIRSLELYKDPSIIVVNKPPGMPVQGGVGIKHSMDALAISSLKYDYSESPRLVHRLDRDSSGVLVLARTQLSASILHSIFREKTSGALFGDIKNAPRVLQKRYWALVIGTPKHSKGMISAPLVKVVLDDGQSERITIDKNPSSTTSQHALTEYKVIKYSPEGYTWMELCPLTGRKHQLRVHCAEALGTPILGDYKYGWHAHRRWAPVPCSKQIVVHEKSRKEKLPFGLDLEGGSISDVQPRLHLHCRQLLLPNISAALEHLQSSPTDDLSKIEKLNLIAPLPSHMETSWDVLRLLL